ncbi:retinal guanylyl cyclase 2 [Aplysia californica]|uniref:Retinal guanylyl cyclase 2 n=1 Tax=Aplysia californica TaxID=6500 RepID=A0ABM0K538_APLCA|nr:retinal guanylyl cyclase 2 [Aplysia californica]
MPALLCVRCITKTPPSHRHVARKGSFVASDTLEFCLRACALWWLPLLMTSVPAVATSGVQKNITIGVMLSMSGPKSLGVEARRAIELSFQRINDSPQYSAITDQDYVFQYLLDDVPCDPSDAFAAMLDIFSRSGEHLHGLAQDAFVGPSCDEVCQPGGRLARYYDVLMISYGCESSIFDDKEEFPTFGRTTPTFKDMEAFFAEVIAHYKWPRVTLVTMTTPVWQETLTEFESRIGSKSVQVMRLSLESVTFIRSQEFVEVLKNESERSRVFVLLMYSDAMLEFMRQADRAGLRDGRYAFLSVDYAGSSAHTGDLTFLDVLVYGGI